MQRACFFVQDASPFRSEDKRIVHESQNDAWMSNTGRPDSMWWRSSSDSEPITAVRKPRSAFLPPPSPRCTENITPDHRLISRWTPIPRTICTCHSSRTEAIAAIAREIAQKLERVGMLEPSASPGAPVWHGYWRRHHDLSRSILKVTTAVEKPSTVGHRRWADLRQKARIITCPQEIL
ncbi:hypothetical protein OBBRIDRAFT_112263 [Obba rivulosa]|uniref:Uncharacterized protein n=1 Tax=Obba rivulosa TaxID=1052685 RepID=A0A8E2ARM8_9APHY|nr:hypothetical protein OBBRIDRAFT_112263 [Obba rivulosa]